MASTVLRTVACCLVLAAAAAQHAVVFGDDTSASGCRCVPMLNCPALRPLPGQRMTIQLASKLRAAKCGFMGSTLKVCCPSDASTTTLASTPFRPRPTPFRPRPTPVRPRPTPTLPRPTTGVTSPTSSGGIPTDLPLNCGINVMLDRIHGGMNAPLGAYPWMAALGYRVASAGSSSVEFLCGGSLVTRQHVVTAAHCVPPEGHSLKQINLGDWNTLTDPDCETVNGKASCAPPATVRRFAKITTHPQYNSQGKYNDDIAVIRLDEPVEFGVFIQPICIPHSFDPNLRHSDRAPDSIAIGWGATERGANSPILQRVKLPLVDIDSCNRTFVGLLWGNQVCAGGVQGQDSCVGDSGGPLITTGVDSPSFQLVGLTSFGKSLCGRAGNPGVYTAVSNYRNWIIDTLPL